MESSLNITDGGEMPLEVNIFYAVFIPVLILLTVTGNIAILVAFWKMPSLREKPSELLILNLSCVDLSTGLIVLPYWSPVYITPGTWPFGEVGCRILATFNNTTVHASLFAISAISVDRFLLVMKEYPQYLRIQSRKRVYITIIACWIFALATVIPQQGMWLRAKVIDETAREINFENLCLFPPRRVRLYSSTMFVALYCLPVLLLCILSMAFLYFLRRRLKRNRQVEHTWPSTTTTQANLEDEGQQQGGRVSDAIPTVPTVRQPNTSRYIKPAVSLISIVSAMAICMLPYCLYVIIIELFCQRCNEPKVLYDLLLLQFCNACLDPFFYGATQKKIRRFYRSCMTIK
ncbi:neuropeptide Y receptor type 1-like [Amphiura filiformis]|uniref:neuropeptide Y receptor type 1-like n=1 Tax=Amphiura filiformis TaxID=82378 RepID=UPI003B213558